MVRQRWLGFSKAQEQIAQNPVKRMRPQEESSPAARGSAQDAAMGSSESQAHLLSVKHDTLGEGIMRDVTLGSDLKGLRIRIIPGPKVSLINSTTGDLEAKAGMICAGFMKGN